MKISFFSLHPVSNLDRWNNLLEIMSTLYSSQREVKTLTQQMPAEQVVNPVKLRKVLTKYFPNLRARVSNTKKG